MSEQINQYLTEIIIAALALLTVMAKNWLGQLKKKAEAYYEAKTTTEQRKILGALADEAFALAESAAKNLGGEAKLTKAVERLLRKAEAYGIKITAEDARAAIERAWLEDKRKEVPIVEVGELKVGGSE